MSCGWGSRRAWGRLGWSRSCLKGVMGVEVGKLEEELDDKTWNHDRNEVLRGTLYSNTIFEWGMVFDRWSIRMSIRVHRKAFRAVQYCWRILEDFHCQEYTQFFDINCGLFVRLHFTIGGYDYRKTARFRQGIHFGKIQVFFADHVHRRSGVINKLSFLRFKIWCRQAPIFRRWQECCFIFLL